MLVFADELDRKLAPDGVAHDRHLACVERLDPACECVADLLRIVRFRGGFARARTGMGERQEMSGCV